MTRHLSRPKVRLVPSVRSGFSNDERSTEMETYIMLTKLTDEGRKTLKQNPKRTKE